MKSTISLVLFTIILFAVACSPGSDLDSKRAQLAKLEASAKELDKEIKELEKEIELLDTTTEETTIPIKVQKLDAGTFTNSIEKRWEETPALV